MDEETKKIIDAQQKQIDKLIAVVSKLERQLKVVAKDTARAKDMASRNQSNIQTLSTKLR